MSVKRTSLLAGAATVAAWLVVSAQAQQVDSEAIPDELRIIQDLPEAVEEGRRALGVGNEPPGEEDVLTDERIEEGRTVRDRGRETLFGDDQSLLSPQPEDSPAERLLPDEDDVPEIEVDPTSPDRDGDDRLRRPDGGRAATADEVEDRITGPEDTVPEPRDPGGVGAGPARGGSSGSLF